MSTVELPSIDREIHMDRLPVTPKPARLQSLDIFRGITIVGMLLVNNLSDERHAYAPLLHSNWHGWTPTDLIFPFFMFIVGVAIPFSMAKRLAETTQSRMGLLAHIWSRSLALVMLGFLVHIIFSNTPSLPPGYPMLHVMRWAAMILGYGGILALLAPIRSQRVSNLTPPIIAVLFVLLIVVMHFIVRRETNSGLAQSIIGGGIFEPHMFRIPGVLQRIGICFGCAGTLALFGGWRTILLSAIALLVLYSALMLKAPFPGHVTGSLAKDDNLEHSVDSYVFERPALGADGTAIRDSRGKIGYTRKLTYNEYADPEGILSTIPAIATPLLGILLGFWLRRTDKTNIEKCAAMLAMGVFVAILGACLDAWLMPINKKIWSPSFVVFTAGMAMLGLGAIFWLVDVRGRKRWAVPFAIFGMNSIAAYVASDVLLRILELTKVQGIVEKSCTEHVQRFSAWLQIHSTHFPILDTPANLTMLFAIALILAMLVLLTPLYVFRIYLKV